MSSSIGHTVKISIFGQSHSAGIGVVIDGLPPGARIDLDALGAFMARRAPGQGKHTTSRREKDIPEILSGLSGGKTCGAPLAAVIRNTDTRSGDYDAVRDVPRPAHADFTAHVKYGGFNDVSGGGHFSGRLTAPLCIAGGICLQILAERGIHIGAHIAAVGTEKDTPFDAVSVGKREFDLLAAAPFPVLDADAGERMLAAIETARQDSDSVGGIIECAAVGLPAGLGDPMFDGMENRIASIVFGVPAVKGVEFGCGFSSATMRGSEHNDAFYMDDKTVKTRTNNHGGILGGITSGMPVVFRVAIKPTPSIGLEQQSISLSRNENTKLTITGRHDPCIVPRAVPVIEAAAALAILDALLDDGNYMGGTL